MADYLQPWPSESSDARDALVLQCHKANIAIEMAIDYGLDGHRDLILLQKALGILRQRLEDSFVFLEECVSLYENIKNRYPHWVLLALGIINNNSPPTNASILLETNERLLLEIENQQASRWPNEAGQKARLMKMSENFSEIQAHLLGQRWPGPAKPRRK